MSNPYDIQLYKQCDPEEITRLSKIVFVEGHLDRLDDLLLSILPLANVVYYRSIRAYDDREYAKEDLISEAILSIYKDMSLRWDKYIHIDSYYTYYSKVLYNSMISLVHNYHNYYTSKEVDFENLPLEDPDVSAYDAIELKMLRDSIRHNVNELSIHILKCRPVNTNLLINIYKCKYVDSEGLDSLRNRVRVFGISISLFNFYCEHVDYVYRLAYNYQYAMIGGKDKMISRISDMIGRFEDVTYKMLSTSYYDSIIPEIYAEFGSDVAKKFVKTFSGRTVKVPNYKDFCDTLLGGVVLALSEGDKSNLYKISEEYGIPYKVLSRIYKKALEYDLKKG